jgi:hypothetical protein
LAFANAVDANTASDAEVELKFLIKKNKDLFKIEYTSFEDITHTLDVIPLVPDAKIPNRPLFRYSPSELQEMHTQVDALLKHGLIQKSSSPLGSPILFVKKKTGELKMCVDYKAHNKITIPFGILFQELIIFWINYNGQRCFHLWIYVLRISM